MNELMKVFGSEDRMNELTVFQNEQFGQVRTIVKDGEPWFVSADVCRALEVKNARDAVARLDDDEKGVVLTDTLGGQQNVTIVNEPGLYALVLGSRKPEAKAFKRWITHEVIPSIRKHGAYLTPETLSKAIADPQWSIALLTALKEEREKVSSLQEENAAQKQMLAEAAPKVRYCDVVLRSKGAVSISKIAKDYGMSAQEMNQKLADLSIHYRQGSCWLLYQRYARSGYTQSHTTVAPDGKRGNHKTMRATLSTNWTQKGRLFLYEVLKSKLNLVPLIERDEVAA